MDSTPDFHFPVVPVRGTIRLGQFLKLANLVENGGEARVLIQEGEVRVNGHAETRRGHQLSPRDLVQVDLPSGSVGAMVGDPVSDH